MKNNSIVRPCVNGIVPHGPVFHWKDGWMFARSDMGVEIWNDTPKIALTIPLGEWESILNSVSCDLMAGEVLQELRRIRAVTNPMASAQRWVGDCGHEWRKDQSANCPICALVEIRDHWANQYDHPKKSTPTYSGPYGIGVTDGHRAAAAIARKTLVANT